MALTTSACRGGVRQQHSKLGVVRPAPHGADRPPPAPGLGPGYSAGAWTAAVCSGRPPAAYAEGFQCANLMKTATASASVSYCHFTWRPKPAQPVAGWDADLVRFKTAEMLFCTTGRIARGSCRRCWRCHRVDQRGALKLSPDVSDHCRHCKASSLLFSAVFLMPVM